MTQRKAFEALFGPRHKHPTTAQWDAMWLAWKASTARCVGIVERIALESEPDDFALDKLNEAAEEMKGEV